MRLAKGLTFAVMLALLMSLGAGVAAAQGDNAAVADLVDNEGDRVGTAQLVEGPEGVEISVEVQGLEPGEKGIHIHETGDISSSDFESAGDHFNPAGAEHGLNNPEGPHAGDLENIVVEEDGTASYSAVNDRVTLSDGESSLLDEDGSALVIHAGADDQETDPSGESGDRVAAGVIEGAGAGALPDTGGPALPQVAAALALAGAGLLLLRRFARSAVRS